MFKPELKPDEYGGEITWLICRIRRKEIRNTECDAAGCCKRGHLPPSLEQRWSRLWTVSIISCCCLCRAVLLPVARFSWASSSLITWLWLPTSACRLPFSCFSASSSSWCLISISNIFCSKRLRRRKRLNTSLLRKRRKLLIIILPGIQIHWNHFCFPSFKWV